MVNQIDSINSSDVISILESGLPRTERIGDVAGLAPLYSNLGTLYSRREDFDKAVEFCQRSIELAQKLGNLSRVAQSYGNLGVVYARRKDFKRAIDFYQKSLQFAEDIGDLRLVTWLYVNLAEACCGDGNFSDAYDYCSRTQEVLKVVESPDIQAQAHYVLGLIHSKQEFWDDAIEELKRASEMFEDIRDQRGVKISLEEVGKAFISQMNQKSALQQELNPGNVQLIGNNKEFIEIGKILAKVAKQDVTILILGETGTGKSIIARSIHQISNRQKGQWVEIDCGALPEDLLENELFGHERGAYTGASTRYIGKFESARHGTIFLDEIGNMSPALQKKLLRVLQTGEFERLGGTKTQKTDVRIITATNRDLEQLVKEEKFREDLYFRINVVPITLPSLREREEDIQPLAEHFVAQYSEKYGMKSTLTISDGALALLLKHSWPGNVRELENVIQRAVLMTNSAVIYPEHLPEKLRPKEMIAPPDEEKVELPDVSAGMTLKEMEVKLITKTLEFTNGNVTQSAEMLGITRRGLQNKMKRCQIPRQP